MSAMIEAGRKPDTSTERPVFTDIERAIINRLQEGLPLTRYPYADIAAELQIDEATLLSHLKAMLSTGLLTRFGPMFHAGEMGGGLTLAAMRIPEPEFERVTEQVNSFSEVAHNYRREHDLNMWFVLATETPEAIDDTIRRIESMTGFRVYNMPKEEEFHVHLHFSV